MDKVCGSTPCIRYKEQACLNPQDKKELQIFLFCRETILNTKRNKKHNRDVLYFMTHKAILLLGIPIFFLNNVHRDFFSLYINKLCFPKAMHGNFKIRKAHILAMDLFF